MEIDLADAVPGLRRRPVARDCHRHVARGADLVSAVDHLRRPPGRPRRQRDRGQQARQWVARLRRPLAAEVDAQPPPGLDHELRVAEAHPARDDRRNGSEPTRSRDRTMANRLGERACPFLPGHVQHPIGSPCEAELARRVPRHVRALRDHVPTSGHAGARHAHTNEGCKEPQHQPNRPPAERPLLLSHLDTPFVTSGGRPRRPGHRFEQLRARGKGRHPPCRSRTSCGPGQARADPAART